MIQALRHEEEDEVLSEQMTSLSLVMRKSHTLALQEVPGQKLVPTPSSNYDFVKMDVFISPKRKHGDLALSSSSERITSNSLYFSFKSFLDFPTISFSKKRIQEIENFTRSVARASRRARFRCPISAKAVESLDITLEEEKSDLPLDDDNSLVVGEASHKPPQMRRCLSLPQLASTSNSNLLNSVFNILGEENSLQTSLCQINPVNDEMIMSMS